MSGGPDFDAQQRDAIEASRRELLWATKLLGILFGIVLLICIVATFLVSR